MPDVIPILRRRRDRRDQHRRSAQARTQRISFGLGYLVSIVLVILILVAGLLYADLTSDLPSIEILPHLLNPPDGLLLQPTRVYDRTGQHLLRTFAPSESPRRYIPLDPQNPQHLPESLVRLTIALADPDFWRHSGYAISGADQPDLHPTIAQKLVSSLLLWDEPPSLRRAVRERLLAAQVTAVYGRSQVLEWYLNSANYGQFAYGAEAAAQLYFGQSVTELQVSDQAILAAVSQVPSLNPLDAPQVALQRGRETLHIARSLEILTQPELQQALAETPSPLSNSSDKDAGGAEEIFAPAFVNFALKQLDTQLNRDRLERGGYIIYTSLDYDLQRQATCLTTLYMQRLQGLPEDPQGCDSARLLPTAPAGQPVSQPVVSAVVLDPRTGQVLTMVGETFGGQETALLSAHNTGSLLTPFIYLTGFTRGLSPASLVWDIPEIADVPNQDETYHGPLRLRMALANDYLTPAAQVLDQMGLENVANIAQSFDLDLAPAAVPLRDSIPLALLDVASAYGTFGAQGVEYGQMVEGRLSPVAVLRVESVDHATWLDWGNPQARSVVTPQLAYLINHIMSDETARWPSLGRPNAFEIGRPAAVKPGQTTDGGDAWAVGYTPYRVTAVWTGTRDRETGLFPRVPAGLWHALMQTASQGVPADGWTMPSGITEIDVCDPSGLLPSRDCPTVVREVFANGSEPTQLDNLYRTYEINRETGLLATVFTPPQMIEERVYMVVPPLARAWADANGLPIPPDSYDAIRPVPPGPNTYITAPAMFADLRGVVDILGTASGNDLDYFRLLYGKGLNPQDWIQLGTDTTVPVQDGILATWDTGDLNGLYAIQLQVVRSDQRVETAIIQATLDNSAPQVSVTYPQQDQVVDFSSTRQLTIQAQVTDNQSLAEVAFYVDENLVGTMKQAPFALVWNVRIGEHTLRVVARDQAGNESEALVNFVVK